MSLNNTRYFKEQCTNHHHHKPRVRFITKSTRNNNNNNNNPKNFAGCGVELSFKTPLPTPPSLPPSQPPPPSGFDPSVLFPERLHCRYIYFHCSYMYNYYNYLEPCALNAEFQHFMPPPRFNKTCLLWGPHSKRG
jgi:hypothetical protein